MAIERQVLREGRAVLLTFPSTFTAADINTMNEAFRSENLGVGATTVHTISDLSAVTRLPSNILSLIIGMIKKKPTKVGTALIVTSNKTVNTYANVLIKTFPMRKFFVCQSVAEALEEVDRLIALEVSDDKQKENAPSPLNQ